MFMFFLEQLLVNEDIVYIHGTIEGQGDHLGDVAHFQRSRIDSRSLSSISRAKTIRKNANRGITYIRSVWIFLNATSIFVTPILTTIICNDFYKIANVKSQFNTYMV